MVSIAAGLRHVIMPLAVGTYRACLRIGLLDTKWGRRLFEFGYFEYKRYVESADVLTFKSFVKPGSVAIDAGANIGFFTLYFAEWVGPNGKVIAVEPETCNLKSLRSIVGRSSVKDRVRIVAAAAMAEAGTVLLNVDPLHPALHRVSADGIPVEAVTLDSLVSLDDEVSIIKIDVQGAEKAVLLGSRGIIARCRPAIIIEIDNNALGASDISPTEIIQVLLDLGYSLRSADNKHIYSSAADVLAMTSKTDYVDLLCIPN